jgi:serine phosphatase RsbU (regulator of sigma subunit)
VSAGSPPLRRLLPPREARERLEESAPLLPGRVLRLLDAGGAALATAGDGTAPGGGDRAGAPGAGWRGAIRAAGAEVGALEIVPAPERRRDRLAAEALRRSFERAAEAGLARRELAAETLERYREVNLLYRLGEVLGGTIDPEAFPRRAVDEALRAVSADAAGILIDPEGEDEDGAIVAVSPDGDASLAAALRDARATLADATQPVILVDGDGDAAAAGASAGAHSVRLWAPLRTRDVTLGGLLLTRRGGNGVFTAGDAKLASALASQAATYLDNARLHQRSLEQARMARELQLAHDVQARLMPTRLPVTGDWELAASWTPAREVAGDFFDAVPCGDEVAVAIGDVADKGMAAALFMALTRSVLRASAVPGRGAGEVVGRANALLCEDAADGMFVTLVLALLGDDGAVRYANAGHNPPLLLRPGCVERLDPTGILVGWDEAAEYGEATVRLAPGDAVLLYTDGVSEARSETGEEYGEERLEAVARRHRAAGADALVQAVLADLRAFVGAAEPFDDATLVAVSRRA